jgi:uncharacterized phosphosugar-binding protein
VKYHSLIIAEKIFSTAAALAAIHDILLVLLEKKFRSRPIESKNSMLKSGLNISKSKKGHEKKENLTGGH